MAIDIASLKIELETNPVGIGYTRGNNRADDVSDAETLNSLETGRTRAVEFLGANDLIAAATIADLRALPDRDFRVFSLITIPSVVNLSDGNIRAMLGMFSGTATETNITALLDEPTSRADELFGEEVGYPNCREARNLT